jgi:hypothetical protein
MNTFGHTNWQMDGVNGNIVITFYAKSVADEETEWAWQEAKAQEHDAQGEETC